MNLFGKLFFRGILKNRPVLGEQVLQELVDDGLLKFSYFLVDSRGRGAKQWRNQGGGANGQLPISFFELPIVIFK